MSFLRKCPLVVVAVVLVLTSASAADPWRGVAVHPIDERAEQVHYRQFRRAVAYAEALNRYKGALYAAVAEQVRYDRAQAARVRAAIEANERHDRAAVEDDPAESGPETQGSGACGGDLPPCYVMMRESGGSLTAENPNSTASGKWQFLDSTWHSVTGLPGSASDYSEAQQDAAARAAWAGGAGCSHWSAC